MRFLPSIGYLSTYREPRGLAGTVSCCNMSVSVVLHDKVCWGTEQLISVEFISVHLIIPLIHGRIQWGGGGGREGQPPSFPPISKFIEKL